MGLNWFLKKACLIKHFQNHGDWVSNGVHLKTSCSIYNLINTSIKQAFWDWITCKWKNAGSSLSTTGFQVPIPSVMIHSTIFVIWPFGMFDSLPMRHFQTQSSYYWPKKTSNGWFDFGFQWWIPPFYRFPTISSSQFGSAVPFIKWIYLGK